MGYIRHRAVIAQMPMPGTPWYEETVKALEDFRASLPGDDWRALVIGPVPAIVESDPWVVFLPDGSGEGWADSDLGDELRERFLGLFPRYVIAEWGDGKPSARVNTEEHYIRILGIADKIGGQ
jgi:hypothetical protein